MTFQFPYRSTIVASLWFSLLTGFIAVLLFIFLSSGWIIWGIAGLLIILASIIFYLRLKMCSVTYSPQEISIQRGILWRSVHRLPIQFISGYTIFRTPLQYLFSISSIIIFSPGTVMFIFGLSHADTLKLVSSFSNKGEMK